MRFNLKKPCSNCPFRTDKPKQKGWLGRKRAAEIVTELIVGEKTFSCHKTLDNKYESHCAGALVLVQKNQTPHRMLQIAERFGIYDPTAIDKESPVFNTAYNFIEFHSID